jgi:hypothetical protein
LKLGITNVEEKRKLELVIDAIFKEADLDGDGMLNKEEIEIACKNSSALKQIINTSVTQVKGYDKIVTEDLEE